MQLKKRDYASPKFQRFGGDGEIFSLICPPQPQDQVGAPEYHDWVFENTGWPKKNNRLAKS